MTLCAPCGVGVPCYLHDSPAAATYQPPPLRQNGIDHEWWCSEGDGCECFAEACAAPSPAEGR